MTLERLRGQATWPFGQEKTPTEDGWGFWYWWAGVTLTVVWKPHKHWILCVACSIDTPKDTPSYTRLLGAGVPVWQLSRCGGIYCKCIGKRLDGNDFK